MVPSDRDVDGVVEMLLDATQRFSEPLTADEGGGRSTSYSLVLPGSGP